MGMAPVDSKGYCTFLCEVCGGHLIDEQNECTRCVRVDRDNLRAALEEMTAGNIHGRAILIRRGFDPVTLKKK